MRVLITGHRGFIGRHFAAHHIQRGDEVLGIDTQDGVDCREFFRYGQTGRFDLVIHCAAIVGGRAKIDGQPLAIADNLSIDSEMFQWATRARPHRIVYFSSSAAYPTKFQCGPERPAMRESSIVAVGRSRDAMVLMPDKMYGWAKLTGEYLAELARADGLKVHVFRPFSGYGVDQSLDYPFPSFIERAMHRADPFVIWGDGKQVRDWIHVDDIVGAVEAAVDADFTEAVNLGTGIGTSMLSLARMICASARYEPEVKTLTEMPTGVSRRVADITKLHQFYEPKISLDDAISRIFKRSVLSA